MTWDKIANDWKSNAYFNFEYLGRIWAEHTGASIVNLQAVKRSSCGRTPKWAPWLHSISWLSYNKYNRCDRFKRSCVWKRHMKRAALLHLKSLRSNKSNLQISINKNQERKITLPLKLPICKIMARRASWSNCNCTNIIIYLLGNFLTRHNVGLGLSSRLSFLCIFPSIYWISDTIGVFSWRAELLGRIVLYKQLHLFTCERSSSVATSIPVATSQTRTVVSEDPTLYCLWNRRVYDGAPSFLVELLFYKRNHLLPRQLSNVTILGCDYCLAFLSFVFSLKSIECQK